jgi:heme-degrading monooxygenase HmoA
MPAITPEQRTAPRPDHRIDGPVTLMNRFVVPPDRDDAFHALWSGTSEYFKAQPGFVSLRLHRAVSADAEHRWVNVATWRSEADFRAAHSTEEFRRVVGQPAWAEFPSSPMLFQVVTSVG